MDQIFEQLKSSPLVDSNVALEEAAMWIDMNISSVQDLIKLFKSIEKNYHTKNDVVDDWSTSFSTLCTAIKKISSNPFSMPQSLQHFSDAALRSIFKTMFCTIVLDHLALSKQFMNYAKNARDDHRKKMNSWRKIGDYKVKTCSRIDESLYEIFAELCERLETKMSSSLSCGCEVNSDCNE